MEESILEFMELTGADHKTAQEYLEFGNYDLNQAVQLFMESQKPETHDMGIQGTSIRPARTIPSIAQSSSMMTSMETSYRNQMTEMDVDMDMDLDTQMQRHLPSRIPRPTEKVWEDNDRLSQLFQPPFDLMFQGTVDNVIEINN